jgi:hypothetical protein
LVANTQSVSTKEDTKLTITLSGTGGSPLTYNITAAPKKGKLTGTGANRTYTPNANINGKDSFYFNVSVGCVASVAAIARITITAVADTPVLAPIGNKTVVRNTALNFTATATDADNGQVLTYSLIGAPAGASINSSTGAFTWTPTTTGNFTFKIRVTDNTGLFDEEQITVTVTNTFSSSTLQSENAVVQGQATIFPNPADDKLYITLNSSPDQLTIRIIDMSGAVMNSNEYRTAGKNKIELNVSQLARGIYILQLQSQQGSQTLRFIKK